MALYLIAFLEPMLRLIPVTQEIIAVFAGLVYMVLFLGASLLMANRVMADSPARTDAQWLSRPINRFTLFRAKAFYYLLAVWLPTLLIRLIGWKMLGLNIQYWPAVGMEYTLYLTTFCAFAAAIASVAPSIRHFTGVLIGLLVGFVIVGALFSKNVVTQEPNAAKSPEVGIVTLHLIIWSAILGFALITLLLQYRRRRNLVYGLALT
ncbi:MAG: hypothetical protein AAF492_18180, partial [Verrucomicrobiota bacterium]